MQNVQIFGLKNSSATRAAQRFFKERRIPIQSIDLKQKPMAAAEVGRFVTRFGLLALLDMESKAYLDAGLKYLKLSEPELLGHIERNPAILKLPLVRAATQLSLGNNEEAWTAMIAKPQGR